MPLDLINNLDENSFEEYVYNLLGINIKEFSNLLEDIKGNAFNSFLCDTLTKNNILCWIHATRLFFGGKKMKRLSVENINLHGEFTRRVRLLSTGLVYKLRC